MQPLRAADYTKPEVDTVYGSTTALDPLQDIDRSERLALLRGFMRDHARGFMQNNLGLNIFSPSGTNSSSLVFQSFSPTAEGKDGNGDAPWFTSGLHHKGFLPFDDAMTMGVNLQHRMWDNGLQLDTHPFYGQNWHSTDNYWGTEFSFGLRADDAKEPWGKIALRYTEGASNLMDRARGFDMHGELRLTDHFGLQSGINQNDSSDLGNYVMLRWRLIGD